MKITKAAMAGTLESSDIMITLEPGNGNVEIDLNSSVDMYYHDQIMDVLTGVLKEMEIDSVCVRAVDHGALDCTIRARMTTAIKRAVREDGV